jgi:hypothetical protein
MIIFSQFEFYLIIKTLSISMIHKIYPILLYNVHNQFDYFLLI